MVSDRAGGAICSWRSAPGYSVVAQRIDNNGTPLWDPAGKLVATGTLGWGWWGPPMPDVETGGGGLITAWAQVVPDGYDLYAQRVTSTGHTVSVGANPASQDLALAIVPNPSRGATVVAASSDRSRTARVVIFDLQGRIVRDLGRVSLERGQRTIQWDGRDAGSRPVRSGVFFARLESENESRTTRFAIVR